MCEARGTEWLEGGVLEGRRLNAWWLGTGWKDSMHLVEAPCRSDDSRDEGSLGAKHNGSRQTPEAEGHVGLRKAKRTLRWPFCPALHKESFVPFMFKPWTGWLAGQRRQCGLPSVGIPLGSSLLVPFSSLPCPLPVQGGAPLEVSLGSGLCRPRGAA